MQTMKFLHDLARQHAFDGGDRHTYAVLVSDQDHRSVYSAALSLVGLWLCRKSEATMIELRMSLDCTRYTECDEEAVPADWKAIL